MIEKVEYNGRLIAIIIRSTYSRPGIEFLTPDEFPQQLGYMNRKAGHIIPAHEHKQMDRIISSSQEVLFVRSGKVKVDLYNDEQTFVETKIVTKGDVIMIASGGHGFEVLEDAEMIEVKQGPYIGEAEKTVYETDTVEKA